MHVKEMHICCSGFPMVRKASTILCTALVVLEEDELASSEPKDVWREKSRMKASRSFEETILRSG